jgi:hypothetical protein
MSTYSISANFTLIADSTSQSNRLQEMVPQEIDIPPDKIESFEISDSTLLKQRDFDKPLLENNWFMIILIALVALMGLIRLKWSKYLSDLFVSIAFSNVVSKIREMGTASRRTASFLLGFMFYANLSLLLFENMRIHQKGLFDFTGWKQLLFLFAFLFAIFSAKVVVYRIIGWIFRIQNATSEYLYQSSLMSKAFGIIILPLVVLFPFLESEVQPWIPRIGLVIFIFLYALQIWKGIKTNLKNALSGYYIILYLCALEILPLSVLYIMLFN